MAGSRLKPMWRRMSITPGTTNWTTKSGNVKMDNNFLNLQKSARGKNTFQNLRFMKLISEPSVTIPVKILNYT